MSTPRYSESSKQRLATAHPNLQKVFNHVLQLGFDHGILEGWRSAEDQAEYFRTGASRVRVSKHNSSPSLAVDARPYVPGLGYPEEHIYFYKFAGVVLCAAAHFGICIRWGGDWDSDRDLEDQEFMDMVHFELVL